MLGEMLPPPPPLLFSPLGKRDGRDGHLLAPFTKKREKRDSHEPEPADGSGGYDTRDGMGWVRLGGLV